MVFRSMAAPASVLTPDDHGDPLNVLGVTVQVLASHQACDVPRITLQSGAEGAGPPPHSHPWSESFYVTKGSVQFMCGGGSTICGAGAFVHVPAGTVHGFSFGPGGGEMLEITPNSSQAVAMFTALHEASSSGPPDVPTVVSVAGRHDVVFHL